MGLEPTNLLTASQALYQLSYAPEGMVRLAAGSRGPGLVTLPIRPAVDPAVRWGIVTRPRRYIVNPGHYYLAGPPAGGRPESRVWSDRSAALTA